MDGKNSTMQERNANLILATEITTSYLHGLAPLFVWGGLQAENDLAHVYIVRICFVVVCSRVELG